MPLSFDLVPPDLQPNFGYLPAQYSEYDRAKVVVIPAPYERHTTGMSGTADAPAAIIRASDIIETFDEERGIELSTVGIATVHPLPLTGLEPEAALDWCRRAVRAVASDGKFALTLGGEHTITPGCVQGLTEAIGQKVHLVQIDAHSDLRSSYLDTPYSHACAMRLSLPYARSLTQIGLRAICEEEWELVNNSDGFIRRFVAGTLDMSQVLSHLRGLEGPVYLTVDMDGFDPSVVPGVGTPEPGGLSWAQAVEIVRTLGRMGTLVAADVNELMPIPNQCASEVAAAKYIWRIISHKFWPDMG